MSFTSDQINLINIAKEKLNKSLTEKLMDPLITSELHHIILNECVVSGGVTASLMTYSKVNDIDLYFKTNEGMTLFQKYMSMKKNQNVIKDSDTTGPYATTLLNGKLVTANATTLFNDLQFITLSTFEEQQASFDFIHCKPYLDIKDNKFFISQTQYDSIASMQLVINNKNSLTEKRLKKFKDRGWKLPDDGSVSL
jgi:hypothetical protein